MLLSLSFFPPVLGIEAGATHTRGRHPTSELHPQPSSFFPLWDLILILTLCSFFFFYVKSISFLKELLPRVPFCNFSEHHFELSRSVIKTWWLSPCGFLALFPSPTFVPLCGPVLNCLFTFTAAPPRWGVQAPSAPPWVPGTDPGADIPGSISWDFLWSEMSSLPSFPVSFLMAADFPRPCGPGSNPLALWHPQG